MLKMSSEPCGQSCSSASFFHADRYQPDPCEDVEDNIFATHISLHLPIFTGYLVLG